MIGEDTLRPHTLVSAEPATSRSGWCAWPHPYPHKLAAALSGQVLDMGGVYQANPPSPRTNSSPKNRPSNTGTSGRAEDAAGRVALTLAPLPYPVGGTGGGPGLWSRGWEPLCDVSTLPFTLTAPVLPHLPLLLVQRFGPRGQWVPGVPSSAQATAQATAGAMNPP